MEEKEDLDFLRVTWFSEHNLLFPKHMCQTSIWCVVHSQQCLSAQIPSLWPPQPQPALSANVRLTTFTYNLGQ